MTTTTTSRDLAGAKVVVCCCTWQSIIQRPNGRNTNKRSLCCTAFSLHCNLAILYWRLFRTCISFNFFSCFLWLSCERNNKKKNKNHVGHRETKKRTRSVIAWRRFKKAAGMRVKEKRWRTRRRTPSITENNKSIGAFYGTHSTMCILNSNSNIYIYSERMSGSIKD